MTAPRVPSFFIVGAPKCGTSSMEIYLGEHPEIFMSPRTEMNFFGRDLSIRRRVETLAEYLSYFEEAGQEQCIGEKSATYLMSKTAAAEIHAFNPRAKIITMLRNPVDAMYSLHGQLLHGANETIVDFEEALDAQSARRRGRRIPPEVQNPSLLLYEEVFAYPEQLHRFHSVFGRDRVHTILLDDVRKDPGEIYRRLLAFLDVSQDHRPEFVQYNRAKSYIPNLGARRFMKAHPEVSKLIHRILPGRAIELGRRSLAFFQRQRSGELSPDLRSRLQARFSDQIGELEGLIDRDLSHWRAGG